MVSGQHRLLTIARLEFKSKSDSGQAILRYFGTSWWSVFHWYIAVTSIFLCLGLAHAGSITGAKAKEFSIPVGGEILLKCPVARDECGPVHSIKWYKDDERVFIYSEVISVARPESSLIGRAELLSQKNDTTSDMRISQLAANDSGLYKCDITYLEVREKCTTVHFFDLIVLVKPEYLRVTLPGSNEVKNNSLIGPYLEGASLSLSCECGSGRPVPDVTWWNGPLLLDNSTSSYSSVYDSQGTGVGRNDLNYVLTRNDVGAMFECQATSSAMTEVWKTTIEIDVYVAPTRIELSGIDGPVQEDKVITLTCKIEGSKPPANITWFNGTNAILHQPLSSATIQIDGTYETESHLTFTASRFENKEEITCEANNEVLAAKLEPPMRASVTLDVYYQPVVHVSPENITVNDSTDVFIVCAYDANPSNITRILWYKDDKELNLDPEKYSGGYPEVPSLFVKSVTRADEGKYSCYVENEVGISESVNSARINVFYPPEVVLTISPDYPIRETDNVTITLSCDVVSGYPTYLERVKWYFRDMPIKELPDCGNNKAPGDEACDQDPSKLKLERVTGSFAGNYSCRGKNGAGWSNVSETASLVVYYPPSIGFLSYTPSKVVKGQTVTLTCEIYDFGFPGDMKFNWYKNDHPITGVSSANWTINPVSLKTEANISCAGANLAGEGPRTSVELSVIAPPAFIERLPPYLGALVDASEVSISCRVECVPICGVEWLKNGQLLISSRHYSIKSTTLPKDHMTNDMDSVVSTLSWNLATLPDGKLDRHRDNANYTCRSSANAVGPGVSSTTYFRVEYPPENISITDSIIRVVEGEKPPVVTCSASAFPEAAYLWKFGDKSILTGENLDLDFEVTRTKAGEYDCVAQNRHGEASIKTYLDVLYKPECTISQQEVNDVIQLVCNVIANPREVEFIWEVDNTTVHDNIETNGLQSILTLSSSSSQRYGTYKCYASNSVGVLDRPCEIDIQDVGIWLAGGDMVILITVIIVSLLLILLIIIIVCCLRKKKKATNKYPTSSSGMGEINELGIPPADGKSFYENLPFHGLQTPPNKPLKSLVPDLEYADLDYRSYGPINYKRISNELAEERKKENMAMKGMFPPRPPKKKDPWGEE